MLRRAATLLLLLLPATLRAQSGEGQVEIYAQILQAEDSRDLDRSVFQRALADPDSAVRREAALGVGRIGNPDGVALLLPLLHDPDSLVQTTTIFALGLLGDTGALPALTSRVRELPVLSGPAALELVTAAARIGGEGGARFISSVLDGSIWSDRADQRYLALRAAGEAWRLGRAAPVSLLFSSLSDPSDDARAPALYSLARLHPVSAAPRLVQALGDRTAPLSRGIAARAMTRAYADSAGLDSGTVADLLVGATADDDPGVRVNAIRSLAGFKQSRLATKLVRLLSDPNQNVQVEAAHTLGQLGGSDAVAELARIAGSDRGSFARRREALLSLARLDSAAFIAQAGPWSQGADWRQRAAAGEGWVTVDPARLTPFLEDRDPRVLASVLQAWSTRGHEGDSALVRRCRALLGHRDAAVRAIAAEGLRPAATPADLPALTAAYALAARDSFPDAAIAALTTIAQVVEAHRADRATLEREVLGTLRAPSDYVILRWAESGWPAAAERWGGAYPLRTGRTLNDYREIARRYLTGPTDARYPHVTIEVDQLGVIELQLFGPDAPLTVANFLTLVDRHFFDGQRFHRVVPNFVVQSGDPRGDGWGGPGTAIRDELNARRHKAYMVAMALSGPDTGGSQWYITLSPQPHLDGRFTIFGDVEDGVPVLLRITQGDLIRTIRR